MEKSRILFVTPILGIPAVGGPELRMLNSIKAIAQSFEVFIIYVNEDQKNIKTIKKGANSCGFFFCAPKKEQKLIRSIKRRLSKWLTYLRVPSWDETSVKLIKKIAEKNCIQTCWMGYGNISTNLIAEVKNKTKLKIICDTDSVWSRFILRELDFASPSRKQQILAEGEKKQIEETQFTKDADLVLAVSEVDADYYKTLPSGAHKVKVFPNVIDLNDYTKNVDANGTKVFQPSILIAGSFGHYHSSMDTAARWFLNEVFPLIKNKINNTHLYIVGRNSNTGFQSDSSRSIHVTGEVPSVLPYFFGCTVLACPLLFESGTRFKILEAGACGIPVVSTRLGAEGLEIEPDRDFLLADKPKEMANKICHLLESESTRKEISANLYKVIAGKYSVTALAGIAKKILD